MGYKFSFAFALIGNVLLFYSLLILLFYGFIFGLIAYKGQLPLEFWLIIGAAGILYLLNFYAAIRVLMKKKFWSIYILFWGCVCGCAAYSFGGGLSLTQLMKGDTMYLTLSSLLFLASFASAMTGKKRLQEKHQNPMNA